MQTIEAMINAQYQLPKASILAHLPNRNWRCTQIDIPNQAAHKTSWHGKHRLMRNFIC